MICRMGASPKWHRVNRTEPTGFDPPAEYGIVTRCGRRWLKYQCAQRDDIEWDALYADEKCRSCLREVAAHRRLGKRP